MFDDKNWFRVFEESSQAFMRIQILLNIPCQFFAHTLVTVMFNKHVNYMSIGFFFVGLLVIDDKNWFRVFEESSQAFMRIRILLNILCQFFVHTLATVTFNKRVNYMSIGFLVVGLLVIDDKNWFRVFKE
jgi:hypothetical protein